MVAFGALLFLACPPQPKSSRAPWIPRHAPWQDGETSSYDVFKGDSLVGLACCQIRAAREGASDHTVWQMTITNTSVNQAFGLHDSMVAVLSQDSLLPRSGFQVRSLPVRRDTVCSRYFQDSVKIVSDSHTTTLAISPNTFDNSILIMAMRSLPLRIGARYLLSSLAAFVPAVLPADISVIGEETIETPAGKIECFQTVLQIAGRTLRLWFEKSLPHRYVQFVDASAGSKAVLREFNQ